MKQLIPGLLIAGAAQAANAANWGEMAWGTGTWSNLTAVPIDSPLFLLGLTVTLASTATWYLKKQR